MITITEETEMKTVKMYGNESENDLSFSWPF
jgi:hypothetical protein